ncbi:hypothetical protein EI94DRAFT_1705467 [Lactarius quietus]|nr:hypothetical protein EI94DRAFT_1705467 [Lactarius quietus]
MSSGPAIITLDVRKKKKKKNKNAPFPDDPKDTMDPGSETPCPHATEMDIFLLEYNEAPLTVTGPTPQGAQVATHNPMSAQQPTRNEDLTTSLPPLDLDIPMAPPTAPSEAPLMITLPTSVTSLQRLVQPSGHSKGMLRMSHRIVTAQAVPKGLAALPINNGLGLTTGPAGLQPTLNKPMMSARLEEAGNANSLSGKHPIHNMVERYTTGTMPPIQDCSPTSIFDYIDIDQIREWEKHPRGKLVAIPFDNDVNISEAHKFLHNQILTAVAEILNTQEVSVAIPRTNDESIRKSKPPKAFFVYNITAEQMSTILERKVWSSKAITFRTAPFAFTCPSFLFSIKSLGMIAIKDIFPIVKGVWDSEETKQYIDFLLNDVPLMLRGQIEDVPIRKKIHLTDPGPCKSRENPVLLLVLPQHRPPEVPMPLPGPPCMEWPKKGKWGDPTEKEQGPV